MRRLFTARADYKHVWRIASIVRPVLATCVVIRVAMSVMSLLMSLLWLGSAATVRAGAFPNDDKTAARPKPPVAQGASAQQDKQVEAAIRAKLAKSKIGKDGFKLRVQGGVATWEGSTDVIQHKGAATRMAKSAGATIFTGIFCVRRKRV